MMSHHLVRPPPPPAVEEARVVEEGKAVRVDHRARAGDGLADVLSAGRARQAEVRRHGPRPLSVRSPELSRRYGEEELVRESVAAPERRVLHRERFQSHECVPQERHARLLALQREGALDLLDLHVRRSPGA